MINRMLSLINTIGVKLASWSWQKQYNGKRKSHYKSKK
jgi:hypothetical protein